MTVIRVVAVSAAALLGVTGCSSHTSGRPAAGSTASSPTHSASATVPTTTDARPSTDVPSTTPTQAAAPGNPSAGTPPCGDSSFDVTAGDQQGATGHGSLVLRFRNRTTGSCTVFGYPGVDALDHGGAALAHAMRTLNGFAGGAHAVSTVTLAPGATASAVLEWMNFNPATAGSCTTSDAIAVTPANTTRTVRLPVRVPVCALQIHPTVAGVTGSQ